MLGKAAIQHAFELAAGAGRAWANISNGSMEPEKYLALAGLHWPKGQCGCRKLDIGGQQTRLHVQHDRGASFHAQWYIQLYQATGHLQPGSLQRYKL